MGTFIHNNPYIEIIKIIFIYLLKNKWFIIKYMKFNYQKEEEDDSDQEFLDSGISTSFTFEKTERNQLRSLRKWLKDIGINYTVTKFRNEEGVKMYCLVAYDETEE